MSLFADAVSSLSRWHPYSDEQARLRNAYLAHLDEHPDGLSRECHPDHLTASALVLSHDRRQVLLNLHRRYRIWVQFGGHCEPDDEALVSAARRETVEECGITDLVFDGMIAQLSKHEVRCGPIRPSHHLDVRYLAMAPADAEAVVSAESLDVRWFDVGAVPAGLEPQLRELVSRAVDGSSRR